MTETEVKKAQPLCVFDRWILCAVFIALMLYSGCDEKVERGTFRFLDAVEVGSEVRVEYHWSPEDPFVPEDTLYLSVTYLREGSSLHARYLPDCVDGDILRFAFNLPEGTEFIACVLCAREQILQSRELSALVTRADVPVRGALPRAIRNAGSHAEALQLFDEDARLYPADLRRHAALWYGEYRSGMPGLSHVDAVLRSPLGGVRRTGSPGSAADTIALRALATFYSGDVENTITTLTALQSSGEGLRHPLVADVLQQIWIACFGLRASPIDDSLRYRVGRVILDLVPKGVMDLTLSTDIARAFPAWVRQEDSARLDHFVAAATRRLNTSSPVEMMGRLELLVHLIDFQDARQRPNEVRRLFERHAASIEQGLLWYASAEHPWVSVMPSYGVESKCRFLYGKALAASGEPEKARSVLRPLVARNTQPENLFAICGSLEILGRLASDASDTIEFQRLQDRHADCQCRPKPESVFSAGNSASSNGKVLSHPVSRYRVPLAWVETDTGRIALNAGDGIPRLLLVTSRSCTVCDIQLPAIARIARRWNTRTQLLLVQSEGDAAGSLLRKLVPQSIPILNHREVLQAFNVRGVPDVRLIVNGEVIIFGITDSVSFARVIASLR